MSNLIFESDLGNEIFTLSIEEIANRVKESLNPTFRGKIKLYFCEETPGTSKERAKRFNQILSQSEAYPNIRIDYYEASISPPIKCNDTSHKNAYRIERNQIGDAIVTTTIEIGRAAEVRVSLNRKLFLPNASSSLILSSPSSNGESDKPKVEENRINNIKEKLESEASKLPVLKIYPKAYHGSKPLKPKRANKQRMYKKTIDNYK